MRQCATQKLLDESFAVPSQNVYGELPMLALLEVQLIYRCSRSAGQRLEQVSLFDRTREFVQRDLFCGGVHRAACHIAV
jgi:hypothetical protein